MASGWSNHQHQWHPPVQHFNMGPQRHGNSNVHRAIPAVMSGPFLQPAAPVAHPPQFGVPNQRAGLLPHPSSLLPFSGPRQPARFAQRVPTASTVPRFYGPPVVSAILPLPATQQPINLNMGNTGVSTITSSSTNSASSRPSDRRRTPRNSEEFVSSRQEPRSTIGSIYHRPPTPVALFSRSPPRDRRGFYDLGDRFYDDDDFDLVYDYRLEFEPYDLSDDSDDDMYYFAHHSRKHSPPARLKGGYECQFVKPFGSEVQTECSICLSVLREPFLVDCCGYRFCRTCIETVEDDHKPCPLCNEDFKTFPDKQLQRMLNQKEVHCKHKDDGCEWTGELASLDEHLNIECYDSDKRLNGCEYTMLKCSHCEKFVQRKDFKMHNIRCSGESYTCEYCNEYSASYHKVTEDHWPDCPAHPVDCPNGCDASLKRSDIAKHVACECPQTLVPCDFSHFGCNAELPRVEMESHFKNEAIQHIPLLTSKYQEAQNEIDELKEEFADMAFELHCLQEVNTSILQDSDNLYDQLEDKDQQLEEKDKEIERLKMRLAEVTAQLKPLPSPSPMLIPTRPQTPPTNDSKALLISNLPPSVDDQKLKSLFGQYGRVVRVVILKNSKALLFFEQPGAINKAVARSKANGLKLLGHRLSLHESIENHF